MSILPQPHNEPVLNYAPGSAERKNLKDTLKTLSSTRHDIPLWIGGKSTSTSEQLSLKSPHNHKLDLGVCHQAGARETEQAIAAALAAAPAWSRTSLVDRAGIFLRAAELLTTRYRATINAATMLGQSKTAHQAEIDAACETADFWRFNCHFAEKIAAEQPVSAEGIWNRVDMRPLEGFVFAVTPFNFTAIGANLPTAPAIMGCTVVWKPAHTAVLSAHYILEILKEAGLPDGVINFVPGDAQAVGKICLEHPALAGVHFTGSTTVFQHMWKTVGERIASYRSYPRVVGETGGKDFIWAHPSCDEDALVTAIVRGAFEYQGQKCSAASRIYLPDSLWNKNLKSKLIDTVKTLRTGDVSDFRNFMGAVIDEKSFNRISSYLDTAHGGGFEIIAGGKANAKEGWFVDPTLVVSSDPKSNLMSEEIFGPVATIYVYPEKDWRETWKLIDQTSPYALTGAIFARDRYIVAEATDALRYAAGNLYVNDKPTGAVVGQQPFGGARASGTNDKAGSLWNLSRWTSPRAIKETLNSPLDYRYPYLQES